MGNGRCKREGAQAPQAINTTQAADKKKLFLIIYLADKSGK